MFCKWSESEERVEVVRAGCIERVGWEEVGVGLVFTTMMSEAGDELGECCLLLCSHFVIFGIFECQSCIVIAVFVNREFLGYI